MTLAQCLKYEGIQQGMQQGIQQRDLEIARGMLLEGLDPALIKRLTHLSDEALKKLLETA